MSERTDQVCQARQASDQMRCICGNVWDMNDANPPVCRPIASLQAYGDLRALRESAVQNEGAYNTPDIDPHVLDRFENPTCKDPQYNIFMWEHISVPEFTCLCPVTKQPDFGVIDIYYKPHDWCVESKSLKLYMGSYRNVGIFHEAVCHRVCYDMKYILMPTWILVVGRFFPRGGIPFTPRVWFGSAPDELIYNVTAKMQP